MKEMKVIICKDIEQELTAFLETLTYDRLFILSDTHTAEKCYPLLKGMPILSDAVHLTIEPDDIHKSLQQISAIWLGLSNEGASRKSLLLNLGGGMVTDMGGFAAATFKRGIRTINIPTTLMGSVDAAVGGKTGFNFNGLKNEIGAFWDPEAVLIDCDFLRTLDRNNFLSGYAEMMKHALISSLDDYISIFLFDIDEKIDYGFFSKMVERSVGIKERFVKEDPTEQGIRKALNFGHTIGHALESLSFEENRPILHGHAVAAGLVAELYLSHCQCGFPMDKLSQVVYYIKSYYPPVCFSCNDYDRIYQFMTHDKKNEAGEIRFTLLGGIGDVKINQQIEKEKIFAALDFYRESFGF